MVLLFSFLESMKNVQTYLPNFQSSAGGSQASAAELVQFIRHKLCDVRQRAIFADLLVRRGFGLVNGH
jgi:hypothetical protein